MQDIIDQRKPPWNIDERGWSSVPGLLTSYGLEFGIFEELDTRKEGVSQSHSFKVYRDVLDNPSSFTSRVFNDANSLLVLPLIRSENRDNVDGASNGSPGHVKENPYCWCTKCAHREHCL